RILQRNFGGHQYPRLAHVGDRTGLEMIRTLQDKTVHSPGVDVYMECTVARLLKDGDRIAGALAYRRDTGRFIVFRTKAVVLATGGIGRAYKVNSNSWEYTGDGQALAYEAGADLMGMEFVQFHPTGMVWPLSVRGILVTEGVRGEGGVLKNTKGERFMFRYIPEMFKKDFADSEAEANRWVEEVIAGRKAEARRPPELLTRDVVARAIAQEVREGRGSPHGGAFLDIASRRRPEDIRKKLPSMYQQFHELADVDITRDAMEVGPTTHYVMGTYVGIARKEDDLRTALAELEQLRARAARVVVEGNRQYNPGWNTAIDLKNLLTVSEAVTRAALERRESRGAHMRVEYPDSDQRFGTVDVIVRRQGERMTEVHGRPRLMCMTRMDQFPPDQPITIAPMKAFPVIKDLVTDVSWNYEVNKRIPPFQPKPPEADGTWRMQQADIDRVQEFRKCIECFLCQDVCHVLRDHERTDAFAGPRFLVRIASLEMHPLDIASRSRYLKDQAGI